jgi:hypothetical protein
MQRFAEERDSGKPTEMAHADFDGPRDSNATGRRATNEGSSWAAGFLGENAIEGQNNESR